MNTKKRDMSEPKDFDPELDALWEEYYEISSYVFEMSGARDKYEAEQAEREFMEEFGDLSHEELLSVIREDQENWRRLQKELDVGKRNEEQLKMAAQKVAAKRELSKQARLKAKEEKKAATASSREEAIALGVSDFYALVRDTLQRFDSLNKPASVVKKDNVKEVRRLMIDFIINESRSTLRQDRAEFERIAKKYVTSETLRVARAQLMKRAKF